MLSPHLPALVALQLRVRPAHVTCFYCDVPLALDSEDVVMTPWGLVTRIGFELPTTDHRMPVSRGGTDDIDNLVLACRTCNSSKCARTDDEFHEWRIVSGYYIRHGYYA